MAKTTYIGVDGVARKAKKAYIGVDGVAHKVKKMYIGVDGVAKLFYSSGLSAADVAALGITYTGDMIDTGIVTMSAVQYRLLTLTSSGTLTVEQDVNAEVWMCGGGTSGRLAKNAGYGGGGGAGAFTATGEVTLSGSMAAVIGAGGEATASEPYYCVGGASSFAGIETSVDFSVDSSTTRYGINGGTGGGGGGNCGKAGTGDGKSKYPFGDTSYFEYPHCAGGGGGGETMVISGLVTSGVGGAGGTNGGNGDDGFSAADGVASVVAGGTGGYYGGGTGSRNASYYGGGGGGGSMQSFTSGNDAGNGYQGVIYIRIPVEQ